MELELAISIGGMIITGLLGALLFVVKSFASSVMNKFSKLTSLIEKQSDNLSAHNERLIKLEVHCEETQRDLNKHFDFCRDNEKRITVMEKNCFSHHRE
ncbi:MAG: hypothetical protein U9O94_00730 [Nanoarchaeota archaeon]|nr:hypothetical protein [Nanoarchaeota archaeon]